MKINPNTSIVDLSYNLSGSLAGIPAVLEQLPATSRVGFDNLPRLDQDAPFGQTWTPTLSGRNLELSVPVYNELAVQKAPFSTDIIGVNTAAYEMEAFVSLMMSKNAKRLSQMQAGESINNKTIFFLNTRSKVVSAKSTFKLVGRTPQGAVWAILNKTYDSVTNTTNVIVRPYVGKTLSLFSPENVTDEQFQFREFEWNFLSIDLAFITDATFDRFEHSGDIGYFGLDDIWIADTIK